MGEYPPNVNHTHGVPTGHFDPEEQEYTTYWTPNGYIAVTKAEAKRRMQQDLPYLVHEFETLRKAFEEITKVLKEAMPDLLKVREIYEIISASGASGEEPGQRENPLGRSGFREILNCTCLLCNPRIP